MSELEYPAGWLSLDNILEEEREGGAGVDTLSEPDRLEQARPH